MSEYLIEFKMDLFGPMQCDKSCNNIVTHISIARQSVVKHILAAKNRQATIEELPFLCNGNVNTPLLKYRNL
jgi:hypothetical protein